MQLKAFQPMTVKLSFESCIDIKPFKLHHVFWEHMPEFPKHILHYLQFLTSHLNHCVRDASIWKMINVMITSIQKWQWSENYILIKGLAWPLSCVSSEYVYKWITFWYQFFKIIFNEWHMSASVQVGQSCFSFHLKYIFAQRLPMA